MFEVPNSLYKIPEPSRCHVEFSGVDYVGPLEKVKETVEVVAGKISQMEFLDGIWSLGPSIPQFPGVKGAFFR